MMKKGFTYLELVIVIVIIGILALLSLERMKRDSLYEAADQIVSHLQYTQHLSMIDDRFDPSDNDWIRKQYRVQFHNITNNHAYSIYRDMDVSDDLSTDDVILRDPITNKLICGKASVCSDNRFEKVDIQKRYGVAVTFSNSNSARQVMFDYIGRPMFNDGTYPDPNDGDIQITLTAKDSESLVINIATETGFISIL